MDVKIIGISDKNFGKIDNQMKGKAYVKVSFMNDDGEYYYMNVYQDDFEQDDEPNSAHRVVRKNLKLGAKFSNVKIASNINKDSKNYIFPFSEIKFVGVDKNNTCANLKIESKHSKNIDTLSNLYNLQKSIQEDVYGYDFSKMQKKMSDIRSFWDWNYHAIQDEMREAYEALGGVKDGNGNAIWKPWKKAHKEYEKIALKDMSESDLKELKFELIDMLHFFFNLAISINMSPEEMFDMYHAKNKENKARQKRGY